jgi:reverse gyrase
LKIPTQRKADLLPTLSKAKRTTPTLVLEKETKAPNQFRGDLITPWKPQENRYDEDLRELMKENGIGRPSTERILLKRYLNVNTSLEIKTGVTNGDWDSVDWYHSK